MRIRLTPQLNTFARFAAPLLGLAAAGMLNASSPGTRPAAAGPVRSNPQLRIVGGTDAPRGAYPWMTALVTRGQTPVNGQFCGGALIHPQWVLTAAHCVEGTAASSLDVVIGVHDLRVTTEGRRIAVSQVVMHPQYGEVNGALANDFALLKLAQPATGIPVLPLVDSATQIATGTLVRSMGWGATSEGGRSSPVLQQVDLNIVSLADASRVYSGLTAAHLAAGVPGGGRDTCQGDSGGPLVVSDGRGGWLHAGGVSFGDGCARAGIPGIYANTLTFRPWILQQVGVQPGDDHGNTTATATAAVLNTPASGRIEAAGDVDFFRVTVSGAGTLNLTSSGTTDVAAALLNSAGTVVAQDDNGAGAPNFQINAPVTAGTWFVRVSGVGTATGAYTLLARWTAAPPAGGAPEIAITGPGGSTIADGTATPSAAAGTDLGAVDITTGSRTVVFTVRNTGTADLTLGAARLSGTAVSHFRIATQVPATVAAGRSASFSVVYDPSAVGTHAAVVSVPNNDADENPYDFVISGSGTGTRDDHGDTIATATRVAVPSMTRGELGGNRDKDVFQVVLTQPATVTFATTGFLDTYGELLDASGRLLASNDDYGSSLNFRIRRSLAAGTYYVAVTGYSGSERGAYVFTTSR